MPDSDSNDSLIPKQPIAAGGEEFSRKVQGLLDGQPKDEATVAETIHGVDAMLDVIAAGLYSMASMLVGEGEDSIRLVETTIARTEISKCADAAEARKNSRKTLGAAAIELITRSEPGKPCSPRVAAACLNLHRRRRSRIGRDFAGGAGEYAGRTRSGKREELDRKPVNGDASDFRAEGGCRIERG